MCLPTFGAWFIAINMVLEFSILQSLVIGFGMYCNDIRLQLDRDMLQDRIRELEKDNIDLKADSQKHNLDIEANKRYGNLT